MQVRKIFADWCGNLSELLTIASFSADSIAIAAQTLVADASPTISKTQDEAGKLQGPDHDGDGERALAAKARGLTTSITSVVSSVWCVSV